VTRRRRTWRAAGTALLAAAAVLFVWPSGAGADSPSAQGWWFRPQQAGTPVALPAPPVVPDKGLYVAQGPNGENLAIAAVDYAVSEPVASTLMLTVASGGAGTVAITACPASSGFKPVQAGAWSDAPGYNCTAAAVEGAVAADGKTVAFALTPDFVTAGGSAVQAVLVPKPGSDPFQVPFEQPGDSSFTPGAGAGAGGADTSPVAAASGAPVSSDAPLADLSGGGALSGFDSGSTLGNNAVTGAPTAPPVAKRRAPRVQVASPVAVSRRVADRAAAVTALGIIGIAMWWLGGRPMPAPKLIGGAAVDGAAVDGSRVVPAAVPVGGIGRFARPRPNPPNRF
jgi:hypothetical protein